MTIIHAGRRERLGPDNRPAASWVSSAGMFVIRDDGTARFDRHYHDFEEFWLVAAGHGIITVGGADHGVGPGDIIRTPPYVEHDIIAVTDELRVFWLSGPLPPGSAGAHLHHDPADAAMHPVPHHPSVAQRTPTAGPASRVDGT